MNTDMGPIRIVEIEGRRYMVCLGKNGPSGIEIEVISQRDGSRRWRSLWAKPNPLTPRARIVIEFLAKMKRL